MPSTASRANAASARSPISTSARPSRTARLAGLPVLRSSATRTGSPRSSSAWARCEPMNPAPPVTSQRAIDHQRSAGRRLGDGRKRRRAQARDQPQRVAVVELLQHHVGQVQPVQLPERVIVPVVVEILVRRLERPPEVRVLGGRRTSPFRTGSGPGTSRRTLAPRAAAVPVRPGSRRFRSRRSDVRREAGPAAPGRWRDTRSARR